MRSYRPADISTHLLWRVAALLAIFAGMACSARADGYSAPLFVHELKIGGLVHDVPHLWSGFSYEPHAIDINLEALLAPNLALFGGTLRPAVGGTINMQGYTSHLYAGARWQVELPANLFFGIGLGAAVHDGHLKPDSLHDKALGWRVLFHIPAEVGLRLDAHNSLSVYFEHTSDANLTSVNEGMDRLGVRYGYRF